MRSWPQAQCLPAAVVLDPCRQIDAVGQPSCTQGYKSEGASVGVNLSVVDLM